MHNRSVGSVMSRLVVEILVIALVQAFWTRPIVLGLDLWQ